MVVSNSQGAGVKNGTGTPDCTIFPLPGAEIRVTMPLFGAKQEFVKKN